MYKLQGFIFINGIAAPVRNDILVSGWDEMNELIQKAGITHYLLTLIEEE